MSCIDFDSICNYFTTTYVKYTTSFSTINDFPCKDDVTFNEFYCFKLDDLKADSPAKSPFLQATFNVPNT